MKTYQQFLEALAARESTGDYKIVNQLGYVGKYQFGEVALIDAGYYRKDGTKANDWKGPWTGKDGIASINDFRNSPAAQENAIRAYMDKQWSYIVHFHLDAYVGKTVGGVEITASGLLAGAHLVGIGGLKTFLTSNGNKVPRDGNHVPITTYIGQFKGYETTLGEASTNEPIKPASSNTFSQWMAALEYLLSQGLKWGRAIYQELSDWVDAEITAATHIFSSDDAPPPVGRTDSGNVIIFNGATGKVTLDNTNGIVQIPLSVSSLDNSGSVSNETAKFNINTGEFLGIVAEGIVTNTTPSNSQIFSLAVDTVNFTTNKPRTLGSGNGGWGLVDTGPGFNASVASPYIDNNGLSNTAVGNMVPDGVRPGAGD
jgi:hypothetical protein